MTPVKNARFPRFVNRETELASLRRRLVSGKPEFLVVYGRRRVGKTHLLQEAFRGQSAIYFVADLGADQDQRRRLAGTVATFAPSPLLTAEQPPDWEALLRYIVGLAERRRVVLILDEFPYLCASQKALPSILQRIWDDVGIRSQLYLVVCGSFMSFMERKVLGAKSPLYGRRTGQLLVEPLNLSSLKELFPRYSPEERITAYAILGGVPAYLIQFTSHLSIPENIEQHVLDRTTFLHDEVRYLLMEELRDPKNYLSILQAVAFGRTRLNEIVQHTGLERGLVGKYLTVLQELRLVEREVSVSERQPAKSRKGIYRLSDPFFRFWFRFVLPHRGMLIEQGARRVLHNAILPQLDTFIGQIFDRICREILRDLIHAGEVDLEYDRLGRWWEADTEIDLVAMRGRAPVLAAECKWSKKPTGENILRELEHKARRLRQRSPDMNLALFSRSGFTPEVGRKGRGGEVRLFDIRKIGV